MHTGWTLPNLFLLLKRVPSGIPVTIQRALEVPFVFQRAYKIKKWYHAALTLKSCSFLFCTLSPIISVIYYPASSRTAVSALCSLLPHLFGEAAVSNRSFLFFCLLCTQGPLGLDGKPVSICIQLWVTTGGRVHVCESLGTRRIAGFLFHIRQNYSKCWWKTVRFLGDYICLNYGTFKINRSRAMYSDDLNSRTIVSRFTTG